MNEIEAKRINEGVAYVFWKSYLKLHDELLQRAMLLQLTGIDKSNVGLMQSYFDDLRKVCINIGDKQCYERAKKEKNKEFLDFCIDLSKRHYGERLRIIEGKIKEFKQSLEEKKNE